MNEETLNDMRFRVNMLDLATRVVTPGTPAEDVVQIAEVFAKYVANYAKGPENE